jgi:hypothetical protein
MEGPIAPREGSIAIPPKRPVLMFSYFATPKFFTNIS